MVKVITILSVAFLLALPLTALSDDAARNGADKVAGGGRAVGKSAGHYGTKAGKAAKGAAKDTGKAAGKALGDIGKGLKKAFR